MDEERTSRTRLKVAGIAAAALLAVPGGIAISNAVAASPDGPAQAQDPAPRQDRERGDRDDCPGKDRRESGTSTTGWTRQ